MIFRKQSNVFFTPFLILTAQMVSFLWQFDSFLKTATVYHENGIFVYEVIDLYLVKNYYYRTNE